MRRSIRLCWAAWIEFSYSRTLLRSTRWRPASTKFTEVSASGIADDFVAGHAADFAQGPEGGVSSLDETRTRIKKPVLHAQRFD